MNKGSAKPDDKYAPSCAGVKLKYAYEPPRHSIIIRVEHSDRPKVRKSET
jgi:hypothetical protein